MKRFTSVVLMLCIAMMCTTPYEAQSQNRRTGGGTSGNSTKKETVQTKGQNTTTSSSTPRRTGSTGSSSITTNTNTSRSSEPKTKMVTPSGQTQKKQNAPKQNTAPAQVQDRRTQGTSIGNNRSHSSEISRKNSDVGRQNIPADRRESKASRPKNDKYGDPMYGNKTSHKSNHKPAAVQYHNNLPPKRGPEYARPYLEPKHRPMPSYRYGDHYFGHRINVLPRGYVVMRIGGIDYYYIDGVYYRRYLLGGYYVCRPPRGTTIASTLFNVALTAIAINTIRDEIARAQRAAVLSTRYGNANTGYVVRTSDDYYNTNLVNQAGQDYYYQDGVFYILHNGQYYVIEPPIGALVTEIPADYDEIVLEGRTYYQVEDTLYKATVIDGALYFEVVCNL